MRHHEVFSAHATMELHRILTNEPTGFPNEIFQSMQVTGVLRLLINEQRGSQTHGFGEVVLNEHIGQSVLNDLKLSKRVVEPDTLFGVVDRALQSTHCPHSFSAHA